MKKQITIGKLNGRFYLIGPDGYSTTVFMWATEEEAIYAKNQEEKSEYLSWVY
jgi:hypothetical protein